VVLIDRIEDVEAQLEAMTSRDGGFNPGNGCVVRVDASVKEMLRPCASQGFAHVHCRL
jgi:hypothetical protein